MTGPTIRPGQPNTPQPIKLRHLTQELAHLTHTWAQTRIQKNSLGRLRRQRDKSLLDEMTLEVAATLEHLTVLGWPNDKIAEYLVSLMDNRYEPVVVNDLRRSYEADKEVLEPDWVLYNQRQMARAFPRLWAALMERFGK